MVSLKERKRISGTDRLLNAASAFWSLLTASETECMIILQGPEDWAQIVRLQSVALTREWNERQMMVQAAGE